MTPTADTRTPQKAAMVPSLADGAFPPVSSGDGRRAQIAPSGSASGVDCEACGRRAGSVNLTDADLDRLADRVAARMASLIAVPVSSPPPGRRLVDAQTLAAALGVTRQTVYRRARALAGERIGDGKRPRWRFDLEAAREAMSSSGGCLSSRQPDNAHASAGAEKRPSRRRRSSRLPNGLPPAGSVLASRPRKASS